MSFARSAGRVLLATLSKGIRRGIFGAAAGATGGWMFEAEVLDTTIIGAITGGINGAVDGFFDQLALETADEAQVNLDNNVATVAVVPNRSVTHIQYLLNLGSYATPLLSKFILDQAKDNDISVGVAFKTYYVGGLTVVAAAIVIGCCTCCIPLMLVSDLLAPATIADGINTSLSNGVANIRNRNNDNAEDANVANYGSIFQRNNQANNNAGNDIFADMERRHNQIMANAFGNQNQRFNL